MTEGMINSSEPIEAIEFESRDDLLARVPENIDQGLDLIADLKAEVGAMQTALIEINQDRNMQVAVRTELIKEKTDLEVELDRLRGLNTNQFNSIEGLRVERDRVIEARDRAVDQRDAAWAELERFKTHVRDRVIEEAERRDWCDEVNDFLESINLPLWTKEYEVAIKLTYVVRHTVEARTERDAREVIHDMSGSDLTEMIEYGEHPDEYLIIEVDEVEE